VFLGTNGDTWGPILGISMAVVGTIVPIVIFGRMGVQARRKKNLLANGIAAKATILSSRLTGTYVNGKPEVLIDFLVEPEGEPPFEATERRISSLLDIPNLQPGAVVTVKYDPARRETVAIDGVGCAVGEQFEKMAESLHAVQQEFAAMTTYVAEEAASRRLNEIGVPSAAIVLRFNERGPVGGDAVAATLDVRVQPHKGPPFESVIHGVFLHSGLAKYQPGKEVHVKYDPSDTSRAAIDLAMHTFVKNGQVQPG